MSLSGAEFKVQSCHRQAALSPFPPSLHPSPPPSPSLQAITGPVLPNFLAACPFGNLERPRQGHSVWCSKPVQRGRLYVTLCFKHGCMTSLTRSRAVQSCTAHSTCPPPTSPLTRRGQRDPCNLIISFSFKSFCLKLHFPRQLTKEEFSECMNE